MAARKRRKHVEEEEHANHERWMVSYSDMLTVMMGLFIVLYAMSQVDMQKFQALRESLAAGFGHQAILTGSNGVLQSSSTTPQDAQAQSSVFQAFDPVTAVSGPGVGAAAAQSSADASAGVLPAARAEATRLEGVQKQIQQRLDAAGLGAEVHMTITDRGLIIGLVADDVFFAPASAQLTPTALRVLDAIAPTLVALPDQVSVEGHANVLPVSGRYPTNWELSADRATQVLRHFVEANGLAPDRVRAVGFGDARPVPGVTGAQALVVDRRVDVVVLSGASDQVRALVPGIVAQDQGK